MTASVPFVAHKFGGSSMRDAERIAQVAAILAAREGEPQVVVVSAMQGVTDALIALANGAAARSELWRDALSQLRERHLTAALALLGARAEPTVEWLEREFADLADVLHALALLGTPSREALDLVQGLGEVWSSRLLSEHFKVRGDAAVWCDAREVLRVRAEELGVMVDWPASQAHFDTFRDRHPSARYVVTGFVARDGEGRATTLGRNGSDYSGAIFGALADAAEVHIWTDVDGVYSADPRAVPEAVLIPELSYHEACELAYFGAKVIHPQTMAPAIERQIPIYIRNTFNPAHRGSRISAERSLEPPVKGVSAFGGLAILNVEGAGMIAVPDTAQPVDRAPRRPRVGQCGDDRGGWGRLV